MKSLKKFEFNFDFVLLLIAILILISSCGRRKSPQGSIVLPDNIERGVFQKDIPDSDGDGIFDSRELEQGMNPFIADMPTITINRHGKTTMGLFLEKDNASSGFVFLGDEEYVRPKSFLREKILFLTQKKLRNRKNSDNDHLSITDESMIFISDWKDEIYFPVRDNLGLYQFKATKKRLGRIISRIKFNIKKTTGFKSVSNIELGTFFYNSAREDILSISKYIARSQSRDSYDLDDLSISGNLVYREIMARSEIAIGIMDFDIERENGQIIKYSEIIKNVNQKTARVILSTEDETRVWRVVSGTNLKSFLLSKCKDLDLNFDSSEILTRWEELQHYDEDSMFWTLLADAKTMDDQLVAGNTYILSHAKARSIFNSGRKEIYSSKLNLTDEFVFEKENIKIGDMVTLEISAVRKIPQFDTYIRQEICGSTDVKRSIKGMPGVYRTVRIMGEYCKVEHRDFKGNLKKNINFSNGFHLNSVRLRIVIGEKEYKLTDFPVEGNGFTILRHGGKLKLRFRISKKMLDGDSRMKIKVLSDPNGNMIKTGFLRYIEIKNNVDKLPKFRFLTYGPVTEEQYSEIIERYDISLKIHGISR